MPKSKKALELSGNTNRHSTTIPNSPSDPKTDPRPHSETSLPIENRKEWEERLKRVHGGKIPDNLTKEFLDRQWEIVKNF